MAADRDNEDNDDDDDDEGDDDERSQQIGAQMPQIASQIRFKLQIAIDAERYNWQMS